MKGLMNLVLVAILAIPMLTLTGCCSDRQHKESVEPKDKLNEHYGS
jgi:outer membrane biogenesis lipoprotein LolB